MATAGVSSSSDAYRSALQDDPVRQSLKYFKQLADSLKSGDLGGAQKAFGVLQQSLQGSAQVQDGDQGAQTGQQSTILQQLGKALDSGDLAGAQKVFENLMRGGSESGDGSKITSGDPAGYSTTGSVQITGSRINVIV